MRTIVLCLFMALLLPGVVLAKRVPPPKVDPVTFEGKRYVAPNQDGRRAYVEVWDISTNRKLETLTVFENPIDPKLEEDVQWVFIQSMKVEQGKLAVTSERGKVYRVALKRPTPKPASGGATNR